MKKNALIYFLLISTTFCFSQIKQGIVIYKKEKLNYLSESDDFKGKNKGRIAYANKVSEIDRNTKMILKEIDFKLIFKNNKSSFSAVPQLEVANNRFIKFAIGGSGQGVYYTDIKEDKYYKEDNAYGEDFIIKFPKQEWILTNDLKQIGDYVCKRALSTIEITGRNGIIKKEVEAWYAPDINIPFGPLGYNGLPGLIIELSVGNDKYIVSKIEINPELNIEIKEPKKGKIVTKKEFDEIGVNMMNGLKKGF
ncbi:MAG: GLPGLI family protein [Lutibacter sp.]